MINVELLYANPLGIQNQGPFWQMWITDLAKAAGVKFRRIADVFYRKEPRWKSARYHRVPVQSGTRG